jgi:fucose 4-O-acetylase-like acetyltransferase
VEAANVDSAPARFEGDFQGDSQRVEPTSNEARATEPPAKVATRKEAEPSRDASIDVARGVAIFGIVLTHVLRGLNAAHLLGHAAWFPEMDRVLCMYELSVFAFLSGTLVAKSLGKRSLGKYLQERTFQFLGIYVIWTLVQGSVQLLASHLINNPSSMGMLFRFWAPTGQLWYLPFLAIATLVFVPMRPWQSERAPWVLGVAAVISIALWGLDLGMIGTQGLGLIVFFVGGMILGVDRLRSGLRKIPSGAAGAGGLALFALGTFIAVVTHATPPTAGWVSRTVATVGAGVVLSVAMSAAVLLFARATRSWSILALCGRRSLDIFLAHIIMASGCRIVLVMLGVHSVVVLIAACFIAGVAGSLLLSTALRRVGLAWVFDGPKLPTGREKRSRPV